MALIGKIRKNSWLLVVLIGLGLGGFIIMDMTSGQQSVFGSNQTVMAEVDGRKIDIREFNTTYDRIYGNSSGAQVFPSRTALWNFYVDETILQNEADEIGLGVSASEVNDLFFSADQSKISPYIRGRYAQNMQQLTQIKGWLDNNQIDDMIDNGQLRPDFRYYWQQEQKQVINERLQSKLSKLVEKGMITPNWMAEMVGTDKNTNMDFAFVQIPFDEIDDGDVSLTEEDYGNYLDANAAKYVTDEETRRVEYVSFDVQATAADSAAIAKQISDSKEDFQNAENDSLYVQNNFGSISMFWVKKSDFNQDVVDSVFAQPVGSVYGPYPEGSNYVAVKILDKQIMQDSADSRHILVNASTPAQFASAAAKVDSLKNLIETGQERFDSLAAKFSDDPGSKNNGGEYGFMPINQFVPEYNDVMFYSGEVGKLYPVRTQFGIHLVEPQGRKGESNEYVRVAYIRQPIIPSQETQDIVREQVLEFVEQNSTLDAMVNSATEQGLNMETSAAFKRNDYSVGSLGGNNSSRNIIRWAFNNDINTPTAEVGDVSPEIYSFQDQINYYTNKIVAVALKSVRPAGSPSVEDVKDEIEVLVVNQKKGDLIKEKIKGMSDLGAIAASFEEVEVDTALNVNFGNPSIPGAGAEPDVVASAFNQAANQISEPIVGRTGVYVVVPTRKGTAATGNLITEKTTNQNSTRNVIRGTLMQALRKTADIEDNRSKFY